MYGWTVPECRFDDVYEYTGNMYDKFSVYDWSDVWNKWTVHGVRSRNGVRNMSGVNTVLGRFSMYNVLERSILEWYHVYSVHCMCRRNIRIDRVYLDDEPRVFDMLSSHGYAIRHSSVYSHVRHPTCNKVVSSRTVCIWL